MPPKEASTHPPYLEMIQSAISELKERTGSSLPALKKYLSAHYQLADGWEKKLNYYLSKAVKEGKLVKVKGSFKLGEELKKPAKKPATEKKEKVKEEKAPKAKKAKVTKKVTSKKLDKPKKATDKAPKKTTAKKAAAKPSGPKKTMKKSAKPKKAAPKQPKEKKAGAAQA